MILNILNRKISYRNITNFEILFKIKNDLTNCLNEINFSTCFLHLYHLTSENECCFGYFEKWREKFFTDTSYEYREF